MRKGKRFLSLFVALFLLCGGVACSNESQNTPSDGKGEEQQPTPPPSDDREDKTEGALRLSHASGAYGAPFTLRVTPAEQTNRIYYTLDGSQPTAASALYEQGIAVTAEGYTDFPLTNVITWDSATYGAYSFQSSDACVCLRLLEVDAEGNAVAQKTASYFVRSGGESYFTLPVISLTMPEEDAIGFYNDIEDESKERAFLEYFDFESGERFSLNTQVKLGGNWTKGFPYRTINVNFNKDENGKKNTPVKVDLFEGRKARDGGALTDFTRFRLHAGGNSQTITWFADAFAQRVAAEVSSDGRTLDVATTGYRPCEVYLNGEYWGLYAIREHYSDVYFAQNYGVDKDDVILIDRAHNIVASPEYADTSVFNTRFSFELKEDDEGERGMALASALFEYLMATDFSVERNYRELCEKIDVQGLADMVLANLYAGNWDFMNNNIKMWRTATVDSSNPYADGKWRFCLHDLDFSFEQQWGDNGLNGANGYLLVDNNNIYNWNVPKSYYTSDEIVYRPGKNYLDFYLGNAYLNYNGIGTLTKAQTCLLSSPMKNEAFRTLFAERAAVVKDIYASSAALDILDAMKAEVETPMRRHTQKWGRNGYSYSTWSGNIAGMREVLTVRPYMKDYLNYFDGGLMYRNGDYFERQIEAAIYRFLQES